MSMSNTQFFTNLYQFAFEVPWYFSTSPAVQSLQRISDIGVTMVTLVTNSVTGATTYMLILVRVNMFNSHPVVSF